VCGRNGVHRGGIQHDDDQQQQFETPTLERLVQFSVQFSLSLVYNATDATMQHAACSCILQNLYACIRRVYSI
jgi:hypothetical protein